MGEAAAEAERTSRESGVADTASAGQERTSMRPVARQNSSTEGKRPAMPNPQRFPRSSCSGEHDNKRVSQEKMRDDLAESSMVSETVSAEESIKEGRRKRRESIKLAEQELQTLRERSVGSKKSSTNRARHSDDVHSVEGPGRKRGTHRRLPVPDSLATSAPSSASDLGQRVRMQGSMDQVSRSQPTPDTLARSPQDHRSDHRVSIDEAEEVLAQGRTKTRHMTRPGKLPRGGKTSEEARTQFDQ